MNTLWNKLLCVILSLALLINLLPVSALALDAPVEQQSTPLHWVEDPLVETTEKTMQPMVTESTEESQAVIVREDVSLREEFTKHFEMSDGSYTATVYNEPVHQLVDGTWIEVDNSLTLSSTKGMAQYKTVNGLTDVSFAQNFGDKLVTMEQDDHFITWGVEATIDTLETMAVASAQLTDNLREPAQAELLPLDLSAVAAEEQKLFATKATSTIQYADALANGVDLEYTVLPSRIKESIILNSPQSIPSYSVTINTSDLLARLLDNREVEFYTEDGETVFTMWAPYMYDSASELSEDIAVELTALGNGQHIITLTPDAEWLNSPDRVYPIVIDPDVSPSRARTNIIDNTVMEGAGNQNKNLDRLYIGKKSGSRVRAYLKYNLMPTIPSGATITTATQTLYITSGTTTGATAGAYMVTGGDWSPDTITWANKPAAATVIHPSINHNNFSHYTFSCLSAVRSWYSGSTSGKNKNYGIAVQYTNETINDYNAFYSADYSVESGRPLLTIQYQIPTSTVTVNEGSTYQLSLSGVSGTISWTSNNAAVATVNTSGKLTGVKAGKATISASMGGVVQKTYTVYVIIPNGVYSIKSHAGFYLGTNGGLSNGTNACIYSHATSGMAQLRQLWKITHLANGYYNIRPLYKLDMALTAPTANIAISQNTQPDTYASTPTYFQWTISHHPTGGGYTLKYTGSNGLALKPADPGTYPGLNAQVTGYSANSAAYNWTLTKISNPPTGVLLYELSSGKTIESGNSRYIPAGTSKTLGELDFAAYAYSGNSATSEKIRWYCVSGSSYVTINSTTGKITALSPGTAVVRGSSTYGYFDLNITVTGNAATDFVFIHQYDDSFTEDPELVGLIDDAVAFVNNAYQRQFGVSFSSSTSPYYRNNAITDDCTLESRHSCHTDDVCGAQCNSSHHKNVYRISNQFYSTTIPQNHVVVFWTNRFSWSYCANGSQTLGICACVYAHRPVIHMMSIDDEEDSNRQKCMSINLAHEFAHTLGMDDKYYNEPHSTSSGSCVMEVYPDNPQTLDAFYENVNKGRVNLFCSSCEAEIDALLAG